MAANRLATTLIIASGVVLGMVGLRGGFERFAQLSGAEISPQAGTPIKSTSPSQRMQPLAGQQVVQPLEAAPPVDNSVTVNDSSTTQNLVAQEIVYEVDPNAEPPAYGGQLGAAPGIVVRARSRFSGGATDSVSRTNAGVSGNRTAADGQRLGVSSNSSSTRQLGAGRAQTGSLSPLSSTLSSTVGSSTLGSQPLSLGAPVRASADAPLGASGTPPSEVTPEATPAANQRVGVFTFISLGDDEIDVRRTNADGEERVATAFEEPNGLTVILDGPRAALDWQALIGDLFLFTTAPALAGRSTPRGFELTRIPDSSILLAVGIKQNDLLVEIDGAPISEIDADTLPLTAVEGSVEVVVIRGSDTLYFDLLRSLPPPAVVPVDSLSQQFVSGQ